MLPHFALSFTPPEVSFAEVLDVGRVNGPVVSLPVGAPAGLYEAIVQRQIVPDGVPPARSPRAEVRVVVQDVLVDVGKDQFTLRHAQDGHRYQSDVAVLRFRFLRL